MAPEDLVARAEILDVLTMYTRGVDRHDMELVRAAYHSDAWDDHGLYAGDLEGLIAFLDRELRAFERTMHVLGNHTVEVRDDVARAETYAVAWHRHVSALTGVVRDNVQGIRYLDVLERRSAIADRRIVLEWMRIDVAENLGAPPEGWARGRRDRDDASYAFFTW